MKSLGIFDSLLVSAVDFFSFKYFPVIRTRQYLVGIFREIANGGTRNKKCGDLKLLGISLLVSPPRPLSHRERCHLLVPLRRLAGLIGGSFHKRRDV